MKKKVLFIMPDLPSGGAEKLLIDILKRIDYSKWDISLLLEYRQGVYLVDIPAEVSVIALHGKNSIWRERLHRGMRIIHAYGLFHRTVYRAMTKMILSGKQFDTIVSFMEGSAVKLHSYVMDHASKNVSWVHIDFSRKHWSSVFFDNDNDELSAYSRMDQIVFVSSEAKIGFQKLFPVEEHKLCVQYNLIDRKDIVEKAASINIEKCMPTICMVGRLNEQKRYDRAIAAASILKSAGHSFELWILGEGQLGNALTQMCIETGVDDIVKFLGFKKPSYAYMRAADIFLNTSDAEGYPLTICEALCLGLPVVATAITGSTEILGDSKYGLLVEETPESIAAGLEQLMNDSDMLDRYRKSAIDGARQFDVDEVMSNIYSIIG